MIDTVERYAPGFKASIVGRQALSPLDLEETFGLVGGDIQGGFAVLDGAMRLLTLATGGPGTRPS